MPPVKSIAVRAVPLPNGSMLAPGRTADVDLTHPEVLAAIDAGLLLALEQPGDEVPATVAAVLEWVADDVDRAGQALAHEIARPEDERRSTLVDKLEQLVAGPNPDEKE